MSDRPTKLDFPIPREGAVSKAGTHRAVIYVPSTTSQDKPISERKFNQRVARVSREVSRIFGGDTVQRAAFGNWIDDRGKLVREKVARIEFFTTPKSYKRHDNDLGRMIHKLAKEWGQWAISYEYQSPKQSRALYFVHPRSRKQLMEMM